jgi:hypothetical protein
MAQQDPDKTDATAAARALRQIEDGLARIARERARVRPEDWATLFRQIGTVLRQLATHPFVIGDMEAELLIDRVLRSETMAAVDERTDDLIDYVLRKADYVAALRAARDGQPFDLPRHVAPRNTSSEVSRAEAAAGPSGDDFLPGKAGSDQDRPRRSLLRL